MPKTLSYAMAPELAVVIFDACVLYPFHLRNIVVQIAVDRLVNARWTDQIHNEWMRNLSVNMPAISIERLQTTRSLMDAALPNALVADYDQHIGAVTLPDTNDRHVVAAALACGVSLILT